MAKKKTNKKNIWLVPSLIAFGSIVVLVGLMFLYIYLIGGFKARYEQLLSFEFATNASDSSGSFLRLSEENATEDYYIFYKADTEKDATYSVLPCSSAKIKNTENSGFYMIAGKDSEYEGNEASNKVDFPYDSLYYKDVINYLRAQFLEDGRDFDAELNNNEVLIYRVYNFKINPTPEDATELDFDLEITSQNDISAAVFGLNRPQIDDNNQVIKDRKDYPILDKVPYDISNEKQVYAKKPIEILVKQNLLDSDDFSDEEYYVNGIYNQLKQKVDEALLNGVWNLPIVEDEEYEEPEEVQELKFDFTVFESENLGKSLEKFEILKSRYKIFADDECADHMYLAAQEIYNEIITDPENKYSTHFEILEENLSLVNLNGAFTLSAVTSSQETSLSGAVERQSDEITTKIDTKVFSASMVDDLNGKKLYINTTFNVELKNFIPQNSNLPYGSTPKITKYFSSNDKIATVNSAGQVIIKAQGEFTIFAFMASLYEYEKYFVSANIASIGDLLNKLNGKIIFASKTYTTQDVEVASIMAEGSLSIGINDVKTFTLQNDTDSISLFVNPDPAAVGLDHTYVGMLKKLKDVVLTPKMQDKVGSKIHDCDKEYIDIKTELIEKDGYQGVNVQITALNEFDFTDKRLVIECALQDFKAYIIVEIEGEALYNASALSGKNFNITYEKGKDDILWKAYFAGERVSDTGGTLASDYLQEYVDLQKFLIDGEEKYIFIDDSSDYKYIKYFVNNKQNVFLTTGIDYYINGGIYQELAGLSLTRVGVSNNYSIELKEGILYPLKASTEPVTIYLMFVKTQVVDGKEIPVYKSLDDTRLYYYNGKYYTKFEGWNSTQENYEFVVDIYTGKVFENSGVYQDDSGKNLLKIGDNFYYAYDGEVYFDTENNPYSSGGEELFVHEVDGKIHLYLNSQMYTSQISEFTLDEVTHYMVNNKLLHYIVIDQQNIYLNMLGRTDIISDENITNTYYTYNGEEVLYSWLYQDAQNNTKYYYAMYEIAENDGTHSATYNKIYYLEGGKRYFYNTNNNSVVVADGATGPNQILFDLTSYSTGYYTLKVENNNVIFENQEISHTDAIVKTNDYYSKVSLLEEGEKYSVDALGNIYEDANGELSVNVDGNYYYNGSSLSEFNPTYNAVYYLRSIILSEGGNLKLTLTKDASKDTAYFNEKGDRITYTRRTKTNEENVEIEVNYFSVVTLGAIYNDSFYASNVYEVYEGEVYTLVDNGTTYYYDNSGINVYKNNEADNIYYSYDNLFAIVDPTQVVEEDPTPNEENDEGEDDGASEPNPDEDNSETFNPETNKNYLQNGFAFITKTENTKPLQYHEGRYYFADAYSKEQVFEYSLSINEVYKNNGEYYSIVEDGKYNYNERDKYFYLLEAQDVFTPLNDIYYYTVDNEGQITIHEVAPSIETPFYFGEEKENNITSAGELDPSVIYYINIGVQEEPQFVQLKSLIAGKTYIQSTYEEYVKQYGKLYMVNNDGYYYYYENSIKEFENILNSQTSPEDLGFIPMEKGKVYKLNDQTTQISVNNQIIEVYLFQEFNKIVTQNIYHDNTGKMVEKVIDKNDESKFKYAYITSSTIESENKFNGITYSKDITIYYETAEESATEFVNVYTIKENTLEVKPESGNYKTIIVGKFYDVAYGMTQPELNNKRIYFNAENGLFYTDADFNNKYYGDFSMVALIDNQYYNFENLLTLAITKGEEKLKQDNGGNLPQDCTNEQKLTAGWEILTNTDNIIEFYNLDGKNVVYNNELQWALATKNYFIKEVLDENFTYNVLEKVETSNIKRLYTYNKVDSYVLSSENTLNLSTNSTLYLMFTDNKENTDEFVTQGKTLQSLIESGLIKYTLTDASGVSVQGVMLEDEKYLSVGFADIGTYDLKVYISANLSALAEYTQLLSIKFIVTADSLTTINVSTNVTKVGVRLENNDIVYYQKDSSDNDILDEDNQLIQDTLTIDLSQSIPNGYTFNEGVTIKAQVYDNDEFIGEQKLGVITLYDINGNETSHFGVVDGKVTFKYEIFDVSHVYYVKLIVICGGVEGYTCIVIDKFNGVINNTELTYGILDSLMTIDVDLYQGTQDNALALNKNNLIFTIDSIELFNKYNGEMTGVIEDYSQDDFKIVGLNKNNEDVSKNNVTDKVVNSYVLVIDTSKAWMDYNENIVVNIKLSTTFGYVHKDLICLTIVNNTQVHFYLNNETYYGGVELKPVEYTQGETTIPSTIVELFKVHDGLLVHCEEFENDGTYYYTTEALKEIEYSASANGGAGGFVKAGTVETVTPDRLFIKDNAGYFKEYGNPTIEYLNGLTLSLEEITGINLGYGSHETHKTYKIFAGSTHLGYVQAGENYLSLDSENEMLKVQENNGSKIICQIKLITKKFDAAEFSQYFNETDKFYSVYNNIKRENIAENTIMKLSKYIFAQQHPSITQNITGINYKYEFYINGFSNYSVDTPTNETLIVIQGGNNIEVNVVQKLYYNFNGTNILVAQINEKDGNCYILAGDLSTAELDKDNLPICIKFTPSHNDYIFSSSDTWYLNMAIVKENSLHSKNFESDEIVLS